MYTQGKTNTKNIPIALPNALRIFRGITPRNK